MNALDTNILVYAHNIASPFHVPAKAFVEDMFNSRDSQGVLRVCLPAQVLMEFINVITWHRLEEPQTLHQAVQIVQDYLNTGVRVLYQQPTQLVTFIELLQFTTTRRKIFDVALVATLKDHNVSVLYTVNTKDFIDFPFLKARNPFA